MLERWHVLEILAGWALPGAGHYLLGQRKRGLIIGVAIMGLWIVGLLVGGVDVITHEATGARPGRLGRLNYWFLGQMLVGPSLIVDRIHQVLDRGGPPRPGAGARYEPAIGRMGEQGTLFTTMAGMMNLLVLLDVAGGGRGSKKEAGG